MTSLVFVKTVAQWLAVQQSYPAVASDFVPVTTDLQVAHGLERLRRPVLELWDFLVPADQAEIRRLAFEQLDWYQPYLGQIKHQGICLAELMKFDLFSTFAICLSVERAFRRLLEKHPARQVAFFGDLQRTQYGAGGIDSDLPEAVLSWLADRSRIDKVPLRRIEPLNGVYWQRQGATRQNGHAAGTTPKLECFFEPGPRGTVLSLCGEPDLTSQRKLRAALKERGYRTASVGLSEQTPPDLDADLLSFTPFLELPFDLSALERDITSAWKKFQKERDVYAGPQPALFANPYLDFQYRFFFDNLLRGARIFEASGSLVDLYAPRLCLVSCDVYGLRRCVVKAAQARGVPVVQAQHGTMIAESDPYVFTSDYVLATGPAHRQRYLASGSPPERVLDVGDPNASALDAERGAALSGAPRARPRILAVTAVIGISTGAPYCNGRIHRQTWQQLAEFARSRPDLEFFIKAHPRFDYDSFYAELNRQYGCFRILDRADKLANILPSVDLVLLVNSMTSGANEAMAHEKPLVYLATAIYDPDPWVNPLLDCGVPVVRNVAGLASVMDDLLHNPAARRHVVEAQDRFLQEAVSLCGDEATSASATAVQAIAESSAGAQPAAEPHIGRITWDYLTTGDVPAFRRALVTFARNSACRHLDAGKLAEWFVAWINAWSRQLGPELRRPNAARNALTQLASVLHLPAKVSRRLAADICREEAHRSREMGDLPRLRRNAVAAILQESPLGKNLGMSRMLLESMLGPVSPPLVHRLKGIFRRTP
ncbi:MAG TPA: hypothetical protein VG099_11955 [Gemmataceae bacterium]|nr:hypothetical protein [Gemmataceae bacterium]